MAAAFRNQHGLVVFRPQFHHGGVQECGRLGPQVHQHIHQGPAHATQEFFFGVGGELEVEPPQGAGFLVEGAVDLLHREVHAVLGQLPLAEGPGKPAPLIADGLAGHPEGSCDGQGFELHRRWRSKNGFWADLRGRA